MTEDSDFIYEIWTTSVICIGVLMFLIFFWLLDFDCIFVHNKISSILEN